MGAIKAKTSRAAKAVRDDLPCELDNGTDPYWELLNRDPEKHYVWANEYEKDFGSVDYYEAKGYEMVTYQGPDMTRPLIGKAKALGEPIRRQGHVLVMIDLAAKHRMDAMVMRRYDAIERSVVQTTNRAVKDHFRGLDRNSEYIQMERAKISELVPEEEIG